MHDVPDQPTPMSRRTALTRMGWSSAALVAVVPGVEAALGAQGLAGGSDSGADPGADPSDDDALLARIVAGPRPFIARRDRPYRLTRTLRIEGGRSVLIEQGTRIVWEGPARDETVTNATTPVAVFEAVGDDVVLASAGEGEVFVECAEPRPFVYAATMRGRRGFTVTNIRARNCQHVHVDSSALEYGAVRTQGADINIARDVRISGGGASFQSMSEQGHGSCLLAYVAGAHVSDASYENVGNGIQWWGGDAGLLDWQNGARKNERKCSGLLIERVSVKGALIGGIWGAMGRDITVRDCSVEDCLDVGFDSEGCDDVTFERCTARNGHNGCFTAFFLNDGVRFVDCRGVVDDKAWPLFRTYNVTQSNADNRNIMVTGGRFECLDPTGPGTMDCAMGPVRELAITGARLSNVRIDTVFLNMHRTRIADNELVFPHPLPSVAAISAGASQGLPDAPGGAIVENNRIVYEASAAAASAVGAAVGIKILEGDFNTNAHSQVKGNLLSGPFATGIALVSASSNVGIVPMFDVSGNRFEGLLPSAPLLSIKREGEYASAPAVNWDAGQTRDGVATKLSQALDPARSPQTR